jgi:tetratricopeptide (TPR) repeat protein
MPSPNLATMSKPIRARPSALSALLVCLLSSPLSGSEPAVPARDEPALLEVLELQLATNRVTVAMVPLENATGDPSLDYWRFAAESLLRPQLAKVQRLRLLPHASIKFGLAQMHSTLGASMDAAGAKRLGEFIEAQHVVWGAYGRAGTKWQITLHILNDLEATAEYLSQLSDIRLRRIATKLSPDLAYAHFKLASKLYVEEQWEEVRKELPVVVRLDTDGGMANCLKAMLSLHENKPDETIEFARLALSHGWPAHDGFVHLLLGGAYYQQGRLNAAREAFRTMLRHSPDEKSANVARKAIARINLVLGND